MKIKKAIACLLVCLLVFNVPAPSAFADAQEFTITGSCDAVEAGSQLTVDINLENNLGFSALNLYYTYNEQYFTLTNIENRVSTLTMTHDKTTVWDSVDNYAGNGTLATLTFDVAKDTPSGEYEILINLISAANDSFKAVEAQAQSIVAEVVPISPKSVTINNSDVTLDADESEQLVATVYPSDAADKSVSWQSSDESVATVDSNGMVTGVKYGTAVITVTTNNGGYTDSCTVKVNCKHQYSVETVPPTYLQQGYNVYTCDICGDSYTDNFVDALPRTDLSQAEILLEYTKAFYKGEPLEPAVTLTYEGDAFDTATELDITYENNNSVGTATVIIKGINKFTGTVEREFDILDKNTVYGDVNGDGGVTISDAVFVARYSAGLTTLTDEQLKAANVNSDDTVNIVDATVIARFNAGLITELPV